jgi:hypothetical protein
MLNKVALQTSNVNEHLPILRSALRDELGNDRDVLQAFGAFTKFDRNGLSLDVGFRTGTTITDGELEWAHKLVTSNLTPLGHYINAQGLMDDLCDPSSRFYLVSERDGSKTPVAFAHFRFTVEGDVKDAMAGEPVVLLRDLHVEPTRTRKGLGKHLCQLLELTARKNSMRGMMVLAPTGQAGEAGRSFLTGKLKGFECVDETWKPAAQSLSSFAKSLIKKPPSA